MFLIIPQPLHIQNRPHFIDIIVLHVLQFKRKNKYLFEFSHIFKYSLETLNVKAYYISR